MALFIMKNFFLRPAVAKVSETDAGKKALEHYDRISRRLSFTPQPSEASLKSSREDAPTLPSLFPSNTADLEMPDDGGFDDEPAEGDDEVDAVATGRTDQPVGPTPNPPTDMDVHYRNRAADGTFEGLNTLQDRQGADGEPFNVEL
eukprot:TRINITY_DN12698_c0_g1_i1.p1 TRINITY_DN12698_c0_g1~~TRINITY_DN12698_c0_g1_i1.p1  ORF type:complete len:166 (-),score=25.67 TRINITY_DN12698_c0_g1_i1:133-570(-)